jgi:hypothetical protein
MGDLSRRPAGRRLLLGAGTGLLGGRCAGAAAAGASASAALASTALLVAGLALGPGGGAEIGEADAAALDHVVDD